jgi:hypothetical protein
MEHRYYNNTWGNGQLGFELKVEAGAFSKLAVGSPRVNQTIPDGYYPATTWIFEPYLLYYQGSDYRVRLLTYTNPLVNGNNHRLSGLWQNNDIYPVARKATPISISLVRNGYDIQICFSRSNDNQLVNYNVSADHIYELVEGSEF